MNETTKQRLRALPSVAALLEHGEVRGWLAGVSRSVVVASLQQSLDNARASIVKEHGNGTEFDTARLLHDAERILHDRTAPSLVPVINATGIVLHTGLGRAPLSESAIEAIAEGASGYCNLEYELETGQRGRRTSHVASKLVEVTGAEAATVVNNNAAATLMILNTFANGREAIVSRGELIEIGGSYRLPDIMRASGALLKEVGTTNRTRLIDYENAIGEESAILLRVHTSNYRVVGFTESTQIEELVELARRRDLLAVDDLGSGAMFDYSAFGLPHEPSVRHAIESGADLVCFSGDKLLGGPQCGIIAGKQEFVRQIEKSPLMRTYRVGKLTLLALEATLDHYIDAADAIEHIPALSMLATTTDDLAPRAKLLCMQLQSALPEEDFLVCSDTTFAGGGSIPGREVQTVVVRWRPRYLSADELVRRLREEETPVVARIRDDAVYFDLKTILDVDFEALVKSVGSVMGEVEGDDENEQEKDAV